MSTTLEQLTKALAAMIADPQVTSFTAADEILTKLGSEVAEIDQMVAKAFVGWGKADKIQRYPFGTAISILHQAVKTLTARGAVWPVLIKRRDEITDAMNLSQSDFATLCDKIDISFGDSSENYKNILRIIELTSTASVNP